jgi:hypothetical protein
VFEDRLSSVTIVRYSWWEITPDKPWPPRSSLVLHPERIQLLHDTPLHWQRGVLAFHEHKALPWITGDVSLESEE